MLTLRNVQTFYGDLQALYGVSLSVKDGEIVSVIGNNGAGKTTTLMTISGVLRPRRGEIHFDARRIDALTSADIVGLGLGHVPEGRQLFPSMTVEENLLMGACSRRAKGSRGKTMARVYDLFPRLRERQRQLAGTLSGGEQQMLAIGRALMSGPKLLLLDEPSMGLAPLIVQEIFRVIGSLAREKGTTILLVEQNARAALKMADRGYVIETGRIILQGDAAELLENREVQRAYLGKDKKEIWER